MWPFSQLYDTGANVITSGADLLGRVGTGVKNLVKKTAVGSYHIVEHTA